MPGQAALLFLLLILPQERLQIVTKAVTNRAGSTYLATLDFFRPRSVREIQVKMRN